MGGNERPRTARAGRHHWIPRPGAPSPHAGHHASAGHLTGRRRLTSRAFLTFVTIDQEGERVPVPELLLETDEERRVAEQAKARRAARLQRKRDSTKSEG